jgi:hypothetical protein
VTNEQHNRYIGYAFLAYGGFQLLMLLFIGIMLFAMFSLPGRPGAPGPPMEFLGFFFGFMLLFQLAFTAPSFIASYGLLKKKSWARIASIIAGVMAAMSVPFGTAACVYALWFFFSDNWKEVYPEKAGQNVVDPYRITAANESRWTGYQTDEKGEPIFHQVEPPDWR